MSKEMGDAPLPVLNIEKALDRAGFGPFQYRLFVLCGLGWSADVGEIRLIGFLLDGHTLEFELTPGEKWVLSAIFFLGMFLGAWIWGYVADFWGRKHAFTATCALTFGFGTGSALTQGPVGLAVCRFGVGLGLGGNLAVDFSMFLEYLPSEYRGKATVWLTGWSAIGNIWASGLAWAVIPNYGWRPYVVLCAAPLLPAMILRLGVKESPRYLLISGEQAQAAEVIVSTEASSATTLVPTGAHLRDCLCVSGRHRARKQPAQRVATDSERRLTWVHA